MRFVSGCSSSSALAFSGCCTPLFADGILVSDVGDFPFAPLFPLLLQSAPPHPTLLAEFGNIPTGGPAVPNAAFLHGGVRFWVKIGLFASPKKKVRVRHFISVRMCARACVWSMRRQHVHVCVWVWVSLFVRHRQSIYYRGNTCTTGKSCALACASSHPGQELQLLHSLQCVYVRWLPQGAFPVPGAEDGITSAMAGGAFLGGGGPALLDPRHPSSTWRQGEASRSWKASGKKACRLQRC